MRKFSTTALLLLLVLPFAFSQRLTQTIRGKIIDADSQLPLIGASALILETNPIIGTITDVNGVFRLANVPVGRITLQLSSVGYEKKTIPNIGSLLEFGHAGICFKNAGFGYYSL
jgi:hypothetical protein